MSFHGGCEPVDLGAVLVDFALVLAALLVDDFAAEAVFFGVDAFGFAEEESTTAEAIERTDLRMLS